MLPLLTGFIFPAIISVILIGFIIGRFKPIRLKRIADFTVYISGPCLVFSLLARQELYNIKTANLTLAAFFVILSIGLLLLIFSKLSHRKLPPEIYFASMFMNTAFLGYPIILFAFGTNGLKYAVIFDVVNALLMFTVGVYIFTLGSKKSKFLKLPFVYATALGLIVSFSHFNISNLILSPLQVIGSLTVPLALFMLGHRLSNIKIKNWKLIVFSLFSRFGLGLVLSLLAVYIFQLETVVANVVIMMSIMPAGINTIVFSEEFEGDTELAASILAATTLAALIILPIILFFFVYLFIPLFLVIHA